MPTETKGFIYIMTNPSFPQYVKIGYAKDVEQRRDELNRSSAVPYSFRIYATYEVNSELSDKKLHSILDKLNPALRTQEEVDGRVRRREFYAMSPEDAYSILEAIAEINGYKHRLKRKRETAEERQDAEIAGQIAEAHRERLSPFAFSKCGIATGDSIEFCCQGNQHTGERFVVADDRHVLYNGEPISLSALAQQLAGTRASIAGPRYFKYNGEWLNDIRERLGT